MTTPDDDRSIVAALLAGQPVRTNATMVRRLLAKHPRAARLVETSGRGFLVLPPPTRTAHTPPSHWNPTDDIDAIFEAVIARSESRPATRSAMASLLRQRHTDETEACAERLDAVVEHWLRQRLWALNLAPELVAHDERHVAAVESLAATLVEPMWNGEAAAHGFLPIELEWLSVASWLHDWGHVGGSVKPIKLDGYDAIVGSSRDVRVLHGLISQHLMGPTWSGMHALEPDVAGLAAVLCGHHQSWTSFGSERPTRRVDDDLKPDPVALLEDLGVQPRTLEEDIQELGGLPRRVDLERVRVLVAILRVADGVDLGRHRVPDIGLGRNAFLARCLHQEAMRTLASLSVTPYDPKTATQASRVAYEVALEAVHGGLGISFDHFSRIDLEVPEILELQKYRDFLIAQQDYFDNHHLVDAVRFSFSEDAFDTIVVPSSDEPTQVEMAIKVVVNDLRRELRKNGVGEVLAARGFRFRNVRTPKAYPTGTAIAVWPWTQEEQP